MYDSPLSLRDYCLDNLRESISCICQAQAQDECEVSRNSLRINIAGSISEELLTSLAEKRQLNDDVLLMFDSGSTQLKHVRIPNAGDLTTKGLRVLKSHKISDLEVTGLSKVTINELIGCLGEWTLHNLRYLNVSYSSFTSSNKFCVIVGLAKLRNLHTLNVSHSEFNHHFLEIVVEDLPLLQNLNISSTRVRDISPLRKCRHRLKSLSIYNLRSASGGNEEFVQVLCDLNQMQYLDISDDRENPLDMLNKEDSTSEILKRPECFPYLTGLDLSGKDRIDAEILKSFVIHKYHYGNSMKFLGLLMTSVCYDDIFTDESHEYYNNELLVSGNATEAMILESLRRYTHRPAFVQRSLYNLYSYTLNYVEPRLDIIELILPAVFRHSRVIGIQMAATACLYNLTKGKIGEQLHPKILRQVVEATLTAMEMFPNHQQLQKNTLLTLCSDRILQDVTFDRFRCTKLVMDSLVSFSDTAMNRMAVAICSILAAKITTAETSSLGAKPVYMETLLNIVNRRASSTEEPDIMLKFTLSALWNLTDESPCTCNMFLEKGGMQLYIKVLNTFKGKPAVETKVLGLLNNISEVSHLRGHLMNSDFLEILRNLLHSIHIDVSYFAAGIFAHLLSDGLKHWHCTAFAREDLLTELAFTVLSWKTPDMEMVTYRSFSPFFPLLQCHDAPQVQLWAIWAIHHVCSKNPKRYCQMLIEEDGICFLHKIHAEAATNCNESLVNICKQTLSVVKQEFPKSVFLS